MLRALATFSVRHRWLVIVTWLLLVGGRPRRRARPTAARSATTSRSRAPTPRPPTTRSRRSSPRCRATACRSSSTTRAASRARGPRRRGRGAWPRWPHRTVWRRCRRRTGPAQPMVSEDGTTAVATVRFAQRAADIDTEQIEAAQEAFAPVEDLGVQVEFGGAALDSARTTPRAARRSAWRAAVLVLLVAFGSVFAMLVPLVTAVLALGLGMGVIFLLDRARLHRHRRSGGRGDDRAGRRHRLRAAGGHPAPGGPGRRAPRRGVHPGRAVHGGPVRAGRRHHRDHRDPLPLRHRHPLRRHPRPGQRHHRRHHPARRRHPAARPCSGSSGTTSTGSGCAATRLDHGGGPGQRLAPVDPPRPAPAVALPGRRGRACWRRWPSRCSTCGWAPPTTAPRPRAAPSARPTSSSRGRSVPAGPAPCWSRPSTTAPPPRQTRRRPPPAPRDRRRRRGSQQVAPPVVNGAGDTAVLTVVPTTSPDAEATEDLVHRLRDGVLGDRRGRRRRPRRRRDRHQHRPRRQARGADALVHGLRRRAELPAAAGGVPLGLRAGQGGR